MFSVFAFKIKVSIILQKGKMELSVNEAALTGSYFHLTPFALKFLSTFLGGIIFITLCIVQGDEILRCFKF